MVVWWVNYLIGVWVDVQGWNIDFPVSSEKSSPHHWLWYVIIILLYCSDATGREYNVIITLIVLFVLRGEWIRSFYRWRRVQKEGSPSTCASTRACSLYPSPSSFVWDSRSDNSFRIHLHGGRPPLRDHPVRRPGEGSQATWTAEAWRTHTAAANAVVVVGYGCSAADMVAAEATASPLDGMTTFAGGRPRNSGTDNRSELVKAAAVRGFDGTPNSVVGCGRPTADCTNTARRWRNTLRWRLRPQRIPDGNVSRLPSPATAYAASLRPRRLSVAAADGKQEATRASWCELNALNWLQYNSDWTSERMCTRARRRARQPVTAVVPYRLRRSRVRGEWGKPRLHALPAGCIHSTYDGGRLSSMSYVFGLKGSLLLVYTDRWIFPNGHLRAANILI